MTALVSPGVLALCGIFSFLATSIAFWNCYQHFKSYSKPALQRHIVRILIIVPIYALGSFFSLSYPQHFLYFDTIRDMYEAFVIHNFLALMLGYMVCMTSCMNPYNPYS